MLLSLAALAGAATVAVAAQDPQEKFVSEQAPLAPWIEYPAGYADDVRRPGFNGRLWVSRPVMGAIQQGPYPIDTGVPGSASYGAYGETDGSVSVRVSTLDIRVDPWQQFTDRGLRRYEAARQAWLLERNYTGGVRTFVNDAVLWTPRAEENQEHADASGSPTPRATIQLPADMPRQRRRIRVDAGGAPAAQLVACPGSGPARISWPMNAPADTVARTQGGMLFGDAARVASK